MFPFSVQWIEAQAVGAEKILEELRRGFVYPAAADRVIRFQPVIWPIEKSELAADRPA